MLIACACNFSLLCRSTKQEEIAKEQKQRDENVDEYLRMAQNADKSQLPRLKAIFEKRNLKHNVEIHKAQVWIHIIICDLPAKNVMFLTFCLYIGIQIAFSSPPLIYLVNPNAERLGEVHSQNWRFDWYAANVAEKGQRPRRVFCRGFAHVGRRSQRQRQQPNRQSRPRWRRVSYQF